VALSIAGGLGLSVGTATGAGADTGSGTGGTGDGSLHLIPEVITNDGIRAGASADFPIAARLFLPALTDRADQVEKSRAAVTRAVDTLTFGRTQGPSVEDAFAEARSRLFQDYAQQVIPSAGHDSAAERVDLWFIIPAAASVPLTGLAVFLGLRTASRRGSRHA
jgi:hypothetical protein